MADNETGNDTKVIGSNNVETTMDILMKDDPVDEKVVPEELKLEESSEESDDEEADVNDKKEEVEEDDEESEDEEKPEADEEEEAFVTPASRKAILKEFPDFFKKFPSVERSIYRDQQFTESFSTPAEAKEAVEQVENFGKFQNDLFNGDPKSILVAVKEADPRAFSKLVDNYIGALYAVDQGAVVHLINNFHRQTVADMFAAAKESGDEDLKVAAGILHKFVAPGEQWKPPQKFSKDSSAESNEELKKIQSERERLTTERFTASRDTLVNKIDKGLRSTIDQYIDPKNAMSPFVKKNAINEAVVKVNNIIGNDKYFQKTLDRLWDNAFKQNFSEDSMAKIRKAAFQRAKIDLPEVIKSVRREAMSGLTTRKRADDSDGSERKGHLPVGKTASQNSGNANTIRKGESTKDYFARD